jgi:hypothetical protein
MIVVPLEPLTRPPSGFWLLLSGRLRAASFLAREKTVFAADWRGVGLPDYGAHWTCSRRMTHHGDQL